MPRRRTSEGPDPENGTADSSSSNQIPSAAKSAAEGAYELLRKLVAESQISEIESAATGLYLVDTPAEREKIDTIKNHLHFYASTALELGSSVEPLDYGKLPRIQVSLPHSIYFLLKYWAIAEERNLAALAGEVLDRGIREMLRTNSIPGAAVEKYQKICRARLAAAEVNAFLFGDSDASSLKSLDQSAEVSQ